jgi:hypothetical protein
MGGGDDDMGGGNDMGGGGMGGDDGMAPVDATDPNAAAPAPPMCGDPTTLPTRDKLAQLGIKTRDASGKLRSTQDVLGDLAERFATMPDGPVKTAIAIDALGKSGADLIPLERLIVRLQ